MTAVAWQIGFPALDPYAVSGIGPDTLDIYMIDICTCRTWRPPCGFVDRRVRQPERLGPIHLGHEAAHWLVGNSPLAVTNALHRPIAVAAGAKHPGNRVVSFPTRALVAANYA